MKIRIASMSRDVGARGFFGTRDVPRALGLFSKAQRQNGSGAHAREKDEGFLTRRRWSLFED